MEYTLAAFIVSVTLNVTLFWALRDRIKDRRYLCRTLEITERQVEKLEWEIADRKVASINQTNFNKSLELQLKDMTEKYKTHLEGRDSAELKLSQIREILGEE